MPDSLGKYLFLALLCMTPALAWSQQACRSVFLEVPREQLQLQAQKFIQETLGLPESTSFTHTKLLGFTRKNQWFDKLSLDTQQIRAVESYYTALQRNRPVELRPHEAEAQWVDRMVFKKGLLEILQMNEAHVDRTTLRQRLKALLQSKNLRATYDPLSLVIKDKELPPELLTDVLLDGVDAHHRAISTAYRQTRQDRQDMLKRLRVASQWITAIVVTALTLDQLEESLDAISRARGQALMENLDTMSRNLQTLENMLEESGRLQPR